MDKDSKKIQIVRTPNFNICEIKLTSINRAVKEIV